MFLAWREIRFARTRFLLMGLVLGLMSMLIVIISGLTAGLVNDGVSGLKAMRADAVAFEAGTKTDSAFTRSIVDTADAKTFADQPGVEAAEPMGLTIVNAKNAAGQPVDLTLVGVEADGFLSPGTAAAGDTVEGPSLTTDDPAAREIVVSKTLQDEGVALGDTITLDRLGTELTVVGFADSQRTFGHVDIAYTPLRTWQEVHSGTADGQPVPENAYTQASVIVAQLGDAKADLEALSAATGTDVRTVEQSFESSPGYAPETMTMAMIEWFLYIIAALVTGAFFLVWTIQRSGDIAVMRAMGASRKFLMRDSLGQAVVVLAVSIVVGMLIALGLGTLLEQSPMPYSNELPPILTGATLLFAFGLIGAIVAVFRVTRTDPLTALGENR